MQNKLIFWTGNRHCGKTTSACKVAQTARYEGFNVCGLIAPGLYSNGRLVGFEAFDLRSKKRASLARRQIGKSKVGQFDFITEGLKLGNDALSTEAVESADLIIVDEFGPLELKGQGWRRNVDTLLVSSNALILLVVRIELVDAVRQLYADFPQRELAATKRDSVGEVITMLKNRRQRFEGQNVQT